MKKSDAHEEAKGIIRAFLPAYIYDSLVAEIRGSYELNDEELEDALYDVTDTILWAFADEVNFNEEG